MKSGKWWSTPEKTTKSTEPSLKGSLSSVNLTEIFQMLSLSGREGTLFIYDGPRKRAICPSASPSGSMGSGVTRQT